MMEPPLPGLYELICLLVHFIRQRALGPRRSSAELSAKSPAVELYEQGKFVSILQS